MSYLKRTNTGLNDIQYMNPFETRAVSDCLDKNLAAGLYQIGNGIINSPIAYGLLIAINIMSGNGTSVEWYYRFAISTTIFNNPPDGSIYANMANMDVDGNWQGWVNIGAPMAYIQMLKIIAGEA